MTGTRMDGLVVADEVKKAVVDTVNTLEAKNVTPCLATVLVGVDPASAIYIRNKHRACEQCGITTKDHKIPADTTQQHLEDIIQDLNEDDTIHGILVQMPLPKHVNTNDIISRISPQKDVDGLTPYNAGLLSAGRAKLIPCTPLGIIRMLKHYDIGIEGKHAVIINRSVLVGKPLYHLLLQKNATVTTCHSKTKNIKDICRSADIIITGVGNPDKFRLNSNMIKDNSVIIDVAINRIDGKLAGDAMYDDIIQRASYVTPVPGGVGPMTVAMLLRNTVVAAKYA